MGFKSHIWKKKKKPGLVRVRPGHPGSGSTRQVARVWPGCCHSRSFIKPGPVQPPGRPGPGSTRRAGPGLITMVWTIQKTVAKVPSKGVDFTRSLSKGFVYKIFQKVIWFTVIFQSFIMFLYAFNVKNKFLKIKIKY